MRPDWVALSFMMHYARTMGTPKPSQTKLRQIKVLRYAPDGGYAPIEWQRALASAEFAEPIANGHTQHIGVQITKTRTIDIIVRFEMVTGLLGSFAAALGHTKSDALFKHPKRCRKRIPGTRRPLALLGGRINNRTVRVLVCQSK